jgi:hypothetical protein
MRSPVLSWNFFCAFLCESLQGEAGTFLKSPDQKTQRFRGSNCTPTVISRTCPPDVWLNACEGINCSSIQFLSSISDVVLLALFHVSVVIPSPILRAIAYL